ncbi:MAG: HD domain-containing protein [Oscillospiraceae bacterium]
MERADRICRHPLWRESMEALRELERERAFCRHDEAHCLDVARLAYIEALERGLSVPAEQIYAAALLHDIGRCRQYREGVPHHRAGAEMAEGILADCGFREDERAEIVSAISQHRSPETGEREDLAGLLYRADKASRSCLFCAARAECHWSEEKKNLHLKR